MRFAIASLLFALLGAAAPALAQEGCFASRGDAQAVPCNGRWVIDDRGRYQTAQSSERRVVTRTRGEAIRLSNDFAGSLSGGVGGSAGCCCNTSTRAVFVGGRRQIGASRSVSSGRRLRRSAGGRW